MTDELRSGPVDGPRVHAAVTVWGDIDHSAVTAAMGVPPRHTAYRGDVKRPGAAPIKQTYWTWSTEEGESYDGDSFLTAMVEWLEQRRGAVNSLRANENLTIVVSLVAYMEPHHSVPGIYLSSVLLKRFVDLGVDVEFDLTLLGAD